MSRVVFLLGAGASIDAGMPSVVDLTGELKQRLPHVRDVNGQTRREFLRLFDTIAQHDPEASTNYERFFEWLSLLIWVQMDPFRRALSVNTQPCVAAAAGELAFVINRPIYEILLARRSAATYQPHYLVRLRDFIPARSRLQVFTLNYDLTVEDACRMACISTATGFGDTWCPSLFEEHEPGINLYKLHGSLNWFLEGTLPHQDLIEHEPDNSDKLPELILGPGKKLQHDEPFVSLYSEFHQALRRASVCVVIGYSFRDDHIKEPLREASRHGMTIVDVNPASVEWNFDRYKKLSMGAKDALESGAVLSAIKAMT